MAAPLDELRQADRRYALWGLVPEAQKRALRVITLEVRITVHNAFFDRASSGKHQLTLTPSFPPPAPGASDPACQPMPTAGEVVS
jgi:hypothetical protein